MPLDRAINDNLRSIADTERLLSRPHYGAYLLQKLRATSLWIIWQRLLTITRRFRLLSLTLRMFIRLITFLETGTFVLLYVLLIAIALPLVLLGSLFLLIIGILQHKKCASHLAALFDEHANTHIYVCFAHPAALQPHRYFGGMVRALAEEKQNIVLVVSPYFARNHGIAGRHAYLAMRRDAPRLYLIRRHLYFHLRRRLFTRDQNRIILLH